MRILKAVSRPEVSSPCQGKAHHFRGIRWPQTLCELENGRVLIGAVLNREPLSFSLSRPCPGDSYSSSPASTPMGSIESLSSHSSEQNSTTKSTSCQPREKSGGIPWIASPSPSNGQKSLGLWTTSPESSSREDATKTDAESDCQSVASVTSPGDVSPRVDLAKKGSHGTAGQKRASATFLRSIAAAEGEPEWSLLKMS